MVLKLLLNILTIRKMSVKIEDYNLGKELKVLIVFDDMIANMIIDKKLNPVLNELFIRGRKINISLIFITQSYFKIN